jgi:hypothetical protein
MSVDQTAKFDGWASVEIMGHQRELGLVSTEYYGNQAMFRIDSPEIDQREVTLLDGAYDTTSHQYLNRGSRVLKSHIPPKIRIVGSSAIFAINPMSEEDVRAEIGSNGPIASVIEASECPDEMLF